MHISFVRSITMDAFKAQEIERMRLGGNKPWRDFFEAAEANVSEGVRSVLPHPAECMHIVLQEFYWDLC